MQNKRKILIQLTFVNGVGNFYTALTQICKIVEECKKINYECHLIFARNSNIYGRNGWNVSDINFEELVDENTFKLFDSVENIDKSIITAKYKDFVCFDVNIGSCWLDIFYSHRDESLIEKINSYRSYETVKKEHFSLLPIIKPKLHPDIYAKVKKFKEKNADLNSAIQFRLGGYGDVNNTTQDLKNLYKKVADFLKNENKNYFLTSSCISCLSEIYKLPNIKIFPFRHEYGDMGDIYSFYDLKEDRDDLLNKLYDIFSEMVFMSDIKYIFHKTVLSWRSTFLNYAIINNQDIEIYNIEEFLK